MSKPKPRVLKPARIEFHYSPDDPFRDVIATHHPPVLSREPGTGSTDRVKRSGHLYFRARVWTENAKGVRLRQSVYAKTERELATKIKALKAPSAARDAKKLTIAQFLESTFLPDMRRRVRLNTLRFNTFSTYRTAVREYIVPAIGKAKLPTFKAKNVDPWLDELKAGARSKSLAFAVLRRAYSHAVEEGLLDRSPLADKKAPGVPKRERRILALHELQRLLEAAKTGEWYPLLYLAVVTSMRFGELAGLQWRDVDLKAGYLRVTQALARTEHGLALTEPKTKASLRRVDLPADAVKVLRDHRKRQRTNPHDLVFTSPSGDFIDAPNFTKRVFRPLLKTAKLPATVTFHGLRHASNVVLASSGVPLKLLQARLGHSTSRVTLDVYSHATERDSRKAADQIGTLLNRGWDNTGDNSRAKGRQAKPRGKQKNLTA